MRISQSQGWSPKGIGGSRRGLRRCGRGTVDWVEVTTSAGKGAITGCRQEDYRSTGFRLQVTG